MKTYTNTNDLFNNNGTVSVRANVGRFVVTRTYTSCHTDWMDVKDTNSGMCFNVSADTFTDTFKEV